MHGRKTARLLLRVGGAILLAGGLSVHGQPTPANGCGTGWNAYLVPDSITLAGCTFKAACDTHDACYDRCRTPAAAAADPPQLCAYLDCRRDGKYHGQGVCRSEYFEKSRWEAEQRRASCDRVFYSNLLDINQGKPLCEAFSLFYLRAVEKFGSGAFFGVAPVAAAREDEVPFSATSHRAIEEFFNSGTEQQFRQLIEDLKGETPAVDPSIPLMYDPARGLRNDR